MGPEKINSLDTQINYIDYHMSGPSLYEMLAEEASELAQASLKVARIMRNENPTPMTIVDALESMDEEFNDILLVGRILSITHDYSRMCKKADRWVERLKEKEAADVHSDTEC